MVIVSLKELFLMRFREVVPRKKDGWQNSFCLCVALAHEMSKC